MHAVITTWRLSKSEQFEEVTNAVGDRLLEGRETHLPGHVAGYAVQTASDQMTLINVYENSESAEASAQALMFIVMSVLENRAELIERKSGPASTLKPDVKHP